QRSDPGAEDARGKFAQRKLARLAQHAGDVERELPEQRGAVAQVNQGERSRVPGPHHAGKRIECGGIAPHPHAFADLLEDLAMPRRHLHMRRAMQRVYEPHSADVIQCGQARKIPGDAFGRLFLDLGEVMLELIAPFLQTAEGPGAAGTYAERYRVVRDGPDFERGVRTRHGARVYSAPLCNLLISVRILPIRRSTATCRKCSRGRAQRGSQRSSSRARPWPKACMR